MGGLLGYILSNGAAHALSPDGVTGSVEPDVDDGAREPGDGVAAAGRPAAFHVDDWGDAEGPSLDW